MGIARKIGHHSLGAGKWSLGIHYPFAFAQRRQPGGEGAHRFQRSIVAEELQSDASVGLHERLKKAPLEQ